MAALSLLPKLGIRYPIIQAPMLPLTTPSLVSAVSNAGALGSYAAGPGNPAALRSALVEILEKTTKPFQVNLFVPPKRSWSELQQLHTDKQNAAFSKVQAQYQQYCGELGVDQTFPVAVGSASPQDTFQKCIEVIIAEKVPVVSFVFGWPDPSVITRLKDAGVFVIGTATTVKEAVALEELGAEAVIAQGYEAGGHRGTWLGVEDGSVDYRHCCDGTLALVGNVLQAVRIPVIAAGGIMDGRGVAAVLALGCQAAQLGTAFLTTTECSTPDFHRARLLSSPVDSPTVLSQAFTGKPARCLPNRISRELESVQGDLPNFFCISQARPLFEAAGKRGDAELYPLWAGQGFPRCREVAAGQLVRQLVEEIEVAAGGVRADGEDEGVEGRKDGQTLEQAVTSSRQHLMQLP